MRFSRRLTALLPILLAAFAAAAPAADEEFLLPDQAFRISGEAAGPDSVVVSWDIADGYYMYQSKFRFRSETAGIDIGHTKQPPALVKHDDFFGDVPIYRNKVSIPLTLSRSAEAGDILTLEATSQGCADAGLCYPPHEQKILLKLPKAAAPALPKPASKGPLAELNQNLGLGIGEDRLLQPDEAFRFSAGAAGPERLRLNWVIADGTYLYKDKVQVSLEDAEGVALGAITWPQADVKKDSIRPDGTIGDIEVYHQGIDLSVPLTRKSAKPENVTLVAKYQGCAERGVCYPPITKQISLELPAASRGQAPAAEPAAGASVQTAAAAAPEQPLSEQDQIAALLASGNLWAIVALFFGFGLLLAFTPCVFPMIPILSGIIAGQGTNITTRKAFVLSVVYVLAMALTYTIAGVLAGLFGANIQAAFQNPWILSAFALVFVALALSMFGFFELQLPSSLQTRLAELSNRQQGGTLAGVAIMGLLSALIVGPCVAPPLAGALIFIGQTGDAALGGTALFALSLGMGAPLVVIGTSAGRLLPRAGAWMDVVKAVFGVLLLGVAIVLLERILPPALTMVLWALLLICSGVYMGALRHLPSEATGWSKLWKGIGFALLVYGVVMLVGVAAGGKDTLQPLRDVGIAGGSAAEQKVAFKRIKTVSDLDREVAAAASHGRPVMLDFYADWCLSCKEMERYTFSDPAVVRELQRFVLLQADVTHNDAQDKALMQGRFGIPGPPAILFFNRSGDELQGYRLVGFKPAAAFLEHLRRAVP
jgi:thiol:disulfide interchange protein DsbD